MVSVIVPTYNNGETVSRALDSLLRLDEPELEVVVADDASVDHTPRVLSRYQGHPRVTLIRRSHRGGPAAARNSALREARGRWLAFLDADMEATPDWLRELLAPLKEGRADCTGGPDFVPPSSPLVSRCVGYSMDSALASGGLRWGETRWVRYLPGTGNMAITREVYQRVGQLNEQFRDSGEDKEWLLRIAEAGFRIRYVPTARAWHYRTRSLWVFWVKMFRCGLRRVDLWRLRPRAFEWPHLAPAVAVALGLAGCWLVPRVALGLGLAWASLEGVLAARRLGHPAALLVAPLTSLLVPLGYGVGIWWRFMQLLFPRDAS